MWYCHFFAHYQFCIATIFFFIVWYTWLFWFEYYSDQYQFVFQCEWSDFFLNSFIVMICFLFKSKTPLHSILHLKFDNKRLWIFQGECHQLRNVDSQKSYTFVLFCFVIICHSNWTNAWLVFSNG